MMFIEILKNDLHQGRTMFVINICAVTEIETQRGRDAF